MNGTLARSIDARTREQLDALERWLEWMATQPAADQIPGWLAAFRQLREAHDDAHR